MTTFSGKLENELAQKLSSYRSNHCFLQLPDYNCHRFYPRCYELSFIVCNRISHFDYGNTMQEHVPCVEIEFVSYTLFEKA